MQLHYHKAPRSGFTLVEVVVSIGVFSLVLVTAFAGVGSLMNAMRDANKRTMAASVAMMLGDWRGSGKAPVARGGCDFLSAVPVPPNKVSDQFIGGNSADYLNVSEWYFVKTTSSAKYSDLSSYGDLIVGFSNWTAQSTAVSSFDNGATHVLATFWAVADIEFQSGAATGNRKLRFAGRYLMIESVP